MDLLAGFTALEGIGLTLIYLGMIAFAILIPLAIVGIPIYYVVRNRQASRNVSQLTNKEDAIIRHTDFLAVFSVLLGIVSFVALYGDNLVVGVGMSLIGAMVGMISLLKARRTGGNQVAPLAGVILAGMNLLAAIENYIRYGN